MLVGKEPSRGKREVCSWHWVAPSVVHGRLNQQSDWGFNLNAPVGAVPSSMKIGQTRSGL